MLGVLAMPDHPSSLIAFQRRFPDDDACARYLAELRWPEGFVCPACGQRSAWQLRTKPWTYECRGCRRQTSLKAGSVMHGSKLSLSLWFWAAYLMATHSNGISALQLQRQLALGSYKTAWLLCAKLRAAMVDPQRNPLTGLVEVDETTIHYRHRQAAAAGSFGRSPKGKLLIAGACEIKAKGPGRLRLAHVADASAASLQGFIAAALAPDSTAMTDGWQGYASLPNIIAHQPEVVGTRKAHEVLPWIHRVFSNFKTWALGRLSRPARQAPPGLPRRVRLPIQPPTNATRRLPIPPPLRNSPTAHNIQHVDPTGTNGISLLTHLTVFL
jgi:predicted RNA-binding Zn-ribbon protein involved in translation (DUF1610 family)